MAYLTPDLVQKGLSISSSFAKGGTVATKPVARFAPGGDVEPGDAMSPGEEDAARDATTSGGLGGSAGDFEGVDFGGDDRPGDAEARDEEGGPGGRVGTGGPTPPSDDDDQQDDGDDPRVVSETVLDGDTPTAAEAIMAVQGRPKAVNPVDALASELNISPAAAASLLSSSVPVEKEKVTDVEAKQINFVDADEQADFVGTTSVRAPSPYEQGTLRAGYTAEDLKQAERDLAAAQRDTPPTFGEAAGKPRMSQAGILGGIVDAVANPEATLANAISERGIRSLDGEETGREGGLEVVQADGRTAAYDPERNIVFDSDPFKGLNPFGDERVPKGIQDLYDKQRAKDEEERERDGRGGEPILPEDVAVEEVEAAPKKPPTIDIIPFRPEDFYYLTQQQRQGLPSMMNMRRS
tara:strand:+ start:32 stop:1258 length:1227 start_codon:yes stop_codon:yes gene_type:complete